MKSREARIGKFFWFIQYRKFDAAETAELKEFFLYLQTAHEAPEGRWRNPKLRTAMRPVSICGYHRIVKAFFNFLIEEELIDFDPMRRVKVASEKTEIKQPVSDEDIKKLLAAARTLRHDEAVLLTLLVCQTLGCQHRAEDNACKQWDWLTREQLKRRTGRNAEALAAIDALIKQGCIVARNGSGHGLLTAQQRRQNQNRIYYNLSPALLQWLRSDVGNRPSRRASTPCPPCSKIEQTNRTRKIEHDKRNSYKSRTRTKRRAAMLARAAGHGTASLW